MKNLTQRETEIVELMLAGLSNSQIARELFISVHTVKSILEKVYDKYEIHNRLLLAVHLTKEKFAEK